MAMIRRFVNIVTENYKSGVCSVHRLDVSNHLFYPTTSHAEQANTTGGIVVVNRLPELPAPCTCIQPAPTTTVANGSKMAFFGLVSPSSSESRILCINDAGHSMIYDADTDFRYSMPSLEGGFKGPDASVSLSVVAQAGAKEQDMYMMHNVADGDGQELKSRFDVLRFGTMGFPSAAVGSWWYWQSLPPPPFVCRPGDLISSYMVLEGGRTICLSSAAEGVGGTCYLFDTVRGEWSLRARDDLGLLPFAGRSEYVADLNIWLGFSAQYPRDLCSVSGHYAFATNKPPTLMPLWQDRTPVEWKATKINLINLGSGKFAIAKVCKVIPSIGESDLVEDEFLVLTGVEICRDRETFQHKSIRYICSNDRIHQVL